MEKRAAIELIEQTFNAKFDLEQYILFLRNLLNDYEERDNAYHGISLWEDYRAHINKYERIGKYTDPDGNEMDLLVVETKSLSKLDRARTSLRNFVVKHLNKFNKDYALAAFYSKEDGGADWRFSFIKIEHESYQDSKGKVKTRKELTPAKRYSFLVGEYEQAHTAQKQLLPVLANDYSNPSVEDLESCFSIERVTDEFFEQYKELYLKLSEHFNSDKAVQKILTADGIETDRFTKKLLGQIVFLYFLQKKGWLGVAKDDKMGEGPKRYLQEQYEIYTSKSKNYFKDFLQYLFYEALAKEHNDGGIKYYYDKLKCKIPFLNGGLFEADYDWKNVVLAIPNNLFRNNEKNKAGDKGTGILDVFDRYNFTIKEDEPLEKEVAVDPEMLGKVFENMLEIKERKSKGAFYTPREIVHYMCQESLINYLDNTVNDATESYQPLDSNQISFFGGSATKKGQTKLEIEHKGKILVPKEEIEIFIRKGFLATENDQVIIEKGKETSTYRFKLPDSVRENADVLDEQLTNIKICDPAIGSGAFPVGLLHELVTAQKVLLPYLSPNYLAKKLKTIGLKAADFKKDQSKYTYRIKRHAIQESIYGVDIDASAIDIARLRLWLSLIVDEDDLENIEALPNLDYKIIKGSSLVGLPEKNLIDDEATKELEILKDKFFNVTDNQQKVELRKRINDNIEKILAINEQFTGLRPDFDFKLFFSEVWHKKSGFDIVIGNPPYISYYGNTGQDIDDLTRNFFKNNYDHVKKTNDRINSMNLMTEKGLRILNSNGVLSFITNKTLAVLPSYINLREYLLQKYHFDYIVTNLDPFEAIVDCVVFGINKRDRNKHLKFYNGQLVQAKELPQSMFLTNNKLEFHLSENKELIDKIEIHKGRVQDILTINRGVNIGGCFDYFLSKEKKSGYFPYLSGTRNIRRYNYKWYPEDGYFKFDLEKEKELRDGGATIVLGNPERYNQPRLFIPESGQTIMAAFCQEKIYGSYGLLVGTSNDLLKLKCSCALLNSDVITYYAIEKGILRKGNKATPHVGVRGLNNIPVPELNNKFIDTTAKLVDYITFLKKSDSSILIISFFEQLINALVFELYLKASVAASGKEILQNLEDLKSVDDNWQDAKCFAVIESEFNRLYDPNHIVRNIIETLDSIEEIKTIKALTK